MKRNCKECSKEFNVPPSRMKDGKGIFCSSICHRKNQRPDLIGKKFGMLTVVKFVGTEKTCATSNSKNSLWGCICECGKIKNSFSIHLLDGRTKSCGCLRYLPRGESRLNHFYKTYAATAKKRNLEFKISREQFKNIVSKSCFYCDGQPKEKGVTGQIFNGLIPINGIDRVDNSIGYVINNIVPCCTTCNTMKMALGVETFLSHIEKIHIHQQNKNSKFPISYLTVIS